LDLLGGFVLGLLLSDLVLVGDFSFTLLLGDGSFLSVLDLSNGLFC
jgi:hypothetical protein